MSKEYMPLDPDNLTREQKADFLSRRKSTVFYNSWATLWEALDDKQLGLIVRAFMMLSVDGKEHPAVKDFNRVEAAIFKTMANTLGDSMEKYCRRAAVNKNNRNKKKQQNADELKEETQGLFPDYPL